MSVRCRTCGCESDLEVGFERRRRSFRRRVDHYCPICRHERRQSELAGLLRWTAGSALVAGALLFVAPDLPVAWLALNLLLLDVLVAAGTAIHETGHALAARALGMRVFRIVLGCGRTLWKGPLFGILVEWRAIPFGGMTLVAPIDERAVRTRMALMTLAGPLANLALAAIAWMRHPEVLDVEIYARGLALLSVWCFANLLLGLASLFPLTYTTEAGAVPSDGLRLIGLPFAGPAQIDELLASRFAMEALAARENGDEGAMLEWAERGFAAHPAPPISRDLLALALIENHRWERGRALCQSLLEDPKLRPEQLAVARNNLAYADFLSERDDLLEEAGQLSAEAVRALGWHPAVQGTRGAVLVALGQAESGIALLRSSLEKVVDAGDRARVECALAMGLASRGDLEPAKAALERARAANPRCPLIERASRELDAGCGAPVSRPSGS